ncbi:MAG: shikimate kinase [Methanohalobium sp.]|uniref:shikimate kinase n=1 Tax=Methanohalobium sp. TaxID=2837493 RepID=UPI00397A2070
MTLTGNSYALGAGTIINAIATLKGSAFGVDLKTYAKVELSEDSDIIHGEIDGNPDADTALIERAVELVLQHYGYDYGGNVATKSEIPIASGLKSSSAAANATVLATLDAIGESMEPLDAVRIGVQAAKDSAVTITGAFDDACASFFGGIVLTDNEKMELIKRTECNSDVLIFAPDEKGFSSHTDVSRSKLVADWVNIAYELALDGDYGHAMTLNGFLYCGALGFDTELMMRALEVGVEDVSLSGTGPAFTALVENNKVDELKQTWENCNISGNVIKTKINNKGADYK